MGIKGVKGLSVARVWWGDWGRRSSCRAQRERTPKTKVVGTKGVRSDSRGVASLRGGQIIKNTEPSPNHRLPILTLRDLVRQPQSRSEIAVPRFERRCS